LAKITLNIFVQSQCLKTTKTPLYYLLPRRTSAVRDILHVGLEHLDAGRGVGLPPQSLVEAVQHFRHDLLVVFIAEDEWPQNVLDLKREKNITV